MAWGIPVATFTRNASIVRSSDGLASDNFTFTADLQFSQNAATLNNLNSSLAGSNFTGNMTVRNFNAPQLQFTLNAAVTVQP